MRWYWWLPAFAAGFLIEASIIGSDLFAGNRVVEGARLIAGGVGFGIIMAFPIWFCIAIGRSLRRRRSVPKGPENAPWGRK